MPNPIRPTLPTKSGNPDFWGFITHLDASLSGMKDPGYAWNFTIRNPPKWLTVPATGTTLPEAAAVLDAAANQAWQAISQGNANLLLDAIRVIMDWGKVWYPQGPRTGNEATVTEMATAGTLLPTVRADLAALLAGRWSAMTLMNSGWTKVWAALCPERAIIFDSRVSKCLAENLATYLAGRPLPESLAFRQTVPSTDRRHIPGLPVATSGSQRAQATGVASAIVHALVQYARQIGPGPGRWHAGLSARELEARLFMLGA
jgi:hypothetical protein